MAKRAKADLRKEFIIRRETVPATSRAHLSAAIHRQIFEHAAWKNAATVLVYLSIGSEVETRPILQEAWRLGKRVVVPLIDLSWKETLLSELRQLTDLSPGPVKGIPEPSAAVRCLVDPSKVDLALIPGIAFDRYGGRLGLGGGYFDRLIPLMPKATRLGLAFGIQLIDAPVPMEPHDARMHAIVTEDELIYPEDVG